MVKDVHLGVWSNISWKFEINMSNGLGESGTRFYSDGQMYERSLGIIFVIQKELFE